MTLPLLGTAATPTSYPEIRGWICEPDRAIEIQDFCGIGVFEGDHSEMIAAWLGLLDAQAILHIMETGNEEFFHDRPLSGTNDLQELSKTTTWYLARSPSSGTGC